MRIFDLHVDLSAFCTTNGRFDLSTKKSIGKGFFPDQVDLPRMKEGNVKAILGNICPIIATEKGFDEPKDKIKELFRQISFYFEQDRKLDFKKSGIFVMLSLEGAYCIEEEADLALIPLFKKLGFVSIAPVWNLSNALGTGAYESDSKKGLTKLGRMFIKACEDNGIIIDAVHTSRKTFWDIISVSKKPIFVSHAASFEVCQHRRNLTKQQIKAVSEKGGIIGLCFIKNFIGGDNMDQVILQLKSLVDLAGIDHVAIGGDFDGMARDDLIRGMEDISKYPAFFEACLKNGFTKGEIEKISWKNAVRFFKDNLK